MKLGEVFKVLLFYLIAIKNIHRISIVLVLGHVYLRGLEVCLVKLWMRGGKVQIKMKECCSSEKRMLLCKYAGKEKVARMWLRRIMKAAI